jgi:O-antigen ligase
MQLLIISMFVAIQFYIYQVFDIGGTYGVTSLDILTLIFYIIFLKKIIWNGEKLRIVWHYGFLCFIVLLGSIIISGITPLLSGNYEYIMQYMKSCLHIFFLCLFVFICSCYPLKTELWTNMIKVWLVMSLIINVFGIYQLAARAYDLPLAWMPITNVSMGLKGRIAVSEFGQLSLHWGNFFRATSIFSEPSALASFNTITFIFLIIPIVQKSKSFFKSRTFKIILWITTLAGLILTFSMTGLVGALLVILGVIFFENLRGILPLIRIIIFSIIIFILTNLIVSSFAGISLSELFRTRIEGILSNNSVKNRGTEGESFYYRLQNFQSTIKIWEKHPFIGTGLGLTYSDKEENIFYSVSSVSSALAEMGTIGFLSFTFLFLSLFIISLKFIIHRQKFKKLSIEDQRLMGLLFYVMIQLFISNFISGNNLSTASLWVPMGMIFSIINSTYIKMGEMFYKINIMKKPLKDSFNQTLGIYINYKNTQNSQKQELTFKGK